eukprot:CAMPEP_0174836000 /NCGR_PEP_ID=MMETSP1114-20130205/5764_1 /TAXON_ID=312471 /ORGANISM="Neobodo designis, Strain CCAP 1951/1" /LENGTH=282 /DNA_ID=CAMNT_0016069965 /DNA_START=57 /DNA_END=902 /DNA_ORIENTATION=+
MNRNVSVQHPLSAWLTQHFFYTININWNARTKLIGPGGSVPKLFPTDYKGTVALLRKAAKEFDWTRYDIPKQYKDRGIVDKEMKSVIPENHMVTDGLKLWSTLHKFVEGMVKNIMKDNETLKNDAEIQAWFKELTGELGALNDPGQGHNLGRGIPGNGRMESLEDLTKFLTTLLWIVTGEHASVNNGAYEIYGFVPYSVFTIKLGANATKIDIPEKEIANAMLSRADACEAASFVRLLTLPTRDVVGSYDGPFFAAAKRGHDDSSRKQQVELIDKFREDLEE